MAHSADEGVADNTSKRRRTAQKAAKTRAANKEVEEAVNRILAEQTGRPGKNTANLRCGRHSPVLVQ